MTSSTLNINSNEVLSNAIEKFNTIATSAVRPEIHHIEAPTGEEKGPAASAPIAFVAEGPGRVKPVSLVPFQQEALDLERRNRLANAPGPDRREGTARHETIESFIAHVNHFKDPEHSAVWASKSPTPTLTAIIDYHQKGNDGEPRWGKHRAVYPCPLSESWLAWGGGQVLKMEQDQLGDFLRNRDMDLTEGSLKPVAGGPERKAPSPQFLLNLADNLEIFSSCTVARKHDSTTGRMTLQFNEQSGPAGSIVPPSAFLIFIPVLEGEEARAMEVRMTCTVPKGATQASFTLQIHDGKRLLSESFETVVDKVRTKTGLIVFSGTPE